MRRFLAISLFLAACGQDDVQTDPVGQDTGDDTNASKTDIFIDQSQTPDAEIDMTFVDASTDASSDMARPPSAEWTIHAGGSGVCALHETGRVKCWGGILGREVNGFAGDEPDEMGTNLPFINLGTDRTVKTMVAGGHVCAILDNDRLKCWGTNQYGQLGLGDMDERGRRPGEMGDDLPYVDLGTGRTVRQIAQSIFATCALLDDGGVKCWGLGGSGVLGYEDQIARGGLPGQMGDDLPYVDLGTGLTVRQIFGSHDLMCAMFTDGRFKCWGTGSYGQLGQGEPISFGRAPGTMGDNLPFIDIGSDLEIETLSVGGGSICARLTDGRVKCWGRGTEGQLANGLATNFGDEPNEMGDNLPFADLGGPAVALSSGPSSHCAILETDELICWGSNYRGILALGLPETETFGTDPATIGANFPRTLVAGPVMAVSGTSLTRCATLLTGDVQCWGDNSLGQLGLGDDLHRGTDATMLGENLPFVDLAF